MAAQHFAHRFQLSKPYVRNGTRTIYGSVFNFIINFAFKLKSNLTQCFNSAFPFYHHVSERNFFPSEIAFFSIFCYGQTLLCIPSRLVSPPESHEYRKWIDCVNVFNIVASWFSTIYPIQKYLIPFLFSFFPISFPFSRESKNHFYHRWKQR